MNAFEKSCVLVGYRHGLTIEELAEDNAFPTRSAAMLPSARSLIN